MGSSGKKTVEEKLMDRGSRVFMYRKDKLDCLARNADPDECNRSFGHVDEIRSFLEKYEKGEGEHREARLSVDCDHSHTTGEGGSAVYGKPKADFPVLAADPDNTILFEKCPGKECRSDHMILRSHGDDPDTKFFACPNFPQCQGGNTYNAVPCDGADDEEFLRLYHAAQSFASLPKQEQLLNMSN